MITHSLRRNRDGEAVLTIKVTGGSEIFRFAYYMAHGPVDHMDTALRIFRYLRRIWGREKFTSVDRYMTDGHVTKRGWGRRLRGGA